MSSKKTSRYHIDILFPSFTEEAFKEFYEKIYETGPLTFSAHSLIKIVGYVEEFGRLFLKRLDSILKNGPISRSSLFEFYTDKNNNITKACFRHSVENLPIDIVLVVSNTATVITVYGVNRDNSHEFLNKNLYVRKEKKDANS